MLFLISRAANGPEAMAQGQCDHRNKRYWKEYSEAKKSGYQFVQNVKPHSGLQRR
jgi:hypothetical protein